MIEDFKTIKAVEKDTIEKYRGRLPDEYLEIWQEHGYCTFYGGYLKIIDPEDYQQLLEKTFFLGKESVPIMATAFGDIITWEEDHYVGIVRYRYGDNDILGSGFKYFMTDVEYGELDEDFFSIEQYEEAVDNYGELGYDECFGYVPLLALGGKESVSNLKKVKIREHIALITEMAGEI